jgi:uncharacterized protein with PIN domain
MKKKRKPKLRNLDVVWMLTHCKGDYHKDKRFKRIKERLREELNEQSNQNTGS